IVPDQGEVRFKGMNLGSLNDDQRSDLRRSQFGFVFQFAELVPELTLRENIGLPLELNGVPRRARKSIVDSLVERLGLGEHADRRPSRVRPAWPSGTPSTTPTGIYRGDGGDAQARAADARRDG